MAEKEPSQDQRIEEKIEKYKEMIGNSRAIFVLSSGVREAGTKNNKKYRPTSYKNDDESLTGGHARVLATAEIAQYFPEIKVVATSRYKNNELPLAETYAEELEKLGVPGGQLLLEKESTTTLTELTEMFKIAKKYDWAEVSVLSGEEHLGRIQEMTNHLEELAKKFKIGDEFFEAWEHFEKGKQLQVHLLSAEKILPLRDGRYEKIIEAMKNSSTYAKKMEAEEKGIRQIKDGTYGNK